MDKMQEATDGIETREQERIEADAERDKRISRNEMILRELCDKIQKEQYLLYRGTRKEEREKWIESVFEEIIAENFPKLGEEIVAQTMEAQKLQSYRIQRGQHQDT